MAEPRETYLSAILERAIHVIGLMDREPFSPTRGCMDRTYWAWKFTDFPGARFQEGLCALAFLATCERERNPYFGSDRLVEWIAGGFDFWVGIQRRGGDFDEAYPYERSLAATAFSSFYLSEAFELVGERLPAETSARFRTALSRAATWLTRNDETHGFLSNHLAAASAALYHAYRICGESRFENRSRHFLNKILSHQSDEGWYDEYGGADPGYQTHGSFYLARLFELSGDEAIARSLDSSFLFLANFVHPDGSLGGEYTSRNTQTYYPAAFEMMSGSSGSARWIAETQTHVVSDGAAAGLSAVDAYNLFPLLNNYVFAYRACGNADHRSSRPIPPETAPGMTHFPRAGLLKVRRPGYDAFVGLHKGGVIKAFGKPDGGLAYSDSGYVGRLRSGKIISNQWIDPGRPTEIADDSVEVGGSFYQIKKMVMKPFTFLGFRAFTLTVGRLRALSYWLKSLLVKVLIYKRREIDLAFTRQIRFRDDGFSIEDRIFGSVGNQIERLERAGVFTTIHMGSSRYFVPNDLDGRNDLEPRVVDTSAISGGVVLSRDIRITTGD